MENKPDQTREESPGPDRAHRFGSLMALGSATFLGVNTALARLAYDGGANPATFVFLRFALTVLIVAAVLAFLRRPFRAPRAALPPLLGLAFALVFQGVSYLSSVAYIPVGLAVMLFYTYPLMIALANWLIDGQSIPRGRFMALLAAFAGIALAVGPSFAVLDWRGIVLALMGAFGLMAQFMFSARAMKYTQSLNVTLYSGLFALPMMMAPLLLLGGFQLPETPVAMSSFAGACLLYALALMMQYAAIFSIGKIQTALLNNLEPLISIAAGAILLGELLSGLQYLGGLIVVTALVVSDRPMKWKRK